MLESYEINYDTLAIIPISNKVSRVIEKDDSFIVNKNATEIIDDSCRYFGSTFKGRNEATKNLIGINYKSPIIVEETRDIIFFPTGSPRFNNCYWLSLNNYKSSIKNNKYCSIIFINDIELELNISHESLKNQILRATLLEATLKKRRK